eukprot:91233_1
MLKDFKMKNKSKSIYRTKHIDRRKLNEQIWSDQERIEVFFANDRKHILVYGMDCGSIRKIGTWDNANCGRNMKSILINGSEFGLDTSKEYSDPRFNISPKILVIFQGKMGMHKGDPKLMRADVHRYQFVAISPCLVAKGDPFDMMNLLEHFSTFKKELFEDTLYIPKQDPLNIDIDFKVKLLKFSA